MDGTGSAAICYESFDGDVVRAAISKEVLVRTLWEPPFLRKFCYGSRHFYSSSGTDVVIGSAILTEVIFCMCYRKRHFDRKENIAKCIAITFNSPQWRPTRHFLPSSCGCNDRGGCPGIHCSGITCVIKFMLCLTSRA